MQKNKADVQSSTENHKSFVKNNKLILKSQQWFKNEKHNAFTEEISKMALS